MKYIFSFLLIALGLPLHAQTLRTNNTTTNGTTKIDSLWFTHQEYVNYALGNLNMNEVTTNFLLQRSLSYFNPNSYDGKNGNDITITSSNHGLFIYNTFYYSALDTAGNYAPMHPDLLGDELQSRWSQKVVPISLINHAYHAIKLNALQTGLFTTNIDSTILYDNLSRSVSPYEKHRLFVATAFTKADVRSNGDVTFDILPSVLHFTDTLSGALEIDFGDGIGYISVSQNSQKSVYYGTTGTKTIKVKQGGRVSITEINFIKDDIFYNIPDPPIELLRSGQTSKLLSTSYVIPTPILGCDEQLDKPILIIDGFNILKDPEVKDIMLNFRSIGFSENLQNLGYDFIVVKFSNNDASIIENAAALKDYIIQLNNEKVGTHKLNIIGLSMGGLIAKYCLKDMEDSAIDHNVENYFSYDSPHQGAYAPYGLQWLLKDGSYAMKKVKDNFMVKGLLKKLESQAAKELLQFNANDISGTVRNSFASAYLSKGYPSQCNNYAIANGRGDGVGLGYSGGSYLMDFAARLASGLVFKNQQELYNLNSSNSTVSYFRTSGAVALLGLAGMSWYSSKIKTSSPQTLETLPGSIDGAHKTYGDMFKKSMENAGMSILIHDYFGRTATAFVSTVSALDLNNQGYGTSGNYIPNNPYYNIQSNHSTVLSSHITPFDDIIYASSTSQSHLEMNQNIANFMFQKIHGSTMPSSPCSNICSFTPDFNGINIPCNITGATTVTIPNMPSGVIIDWHMPTGITLLSGQGTNNIIISNAGLGLYTGGYVSVSWPGCTSANYSFNIDHRVPSLISGPTLLCTSGVYKIHNLPTGATTTWQILGSGASIMSSSNSEIKLFVDYVGPFKVKATVVSSCGTYVLQTDDIPTGFLPYYFTQTEVYADPGGQGSGFICSNSDPYGDRKNIFTYTLNNSSPNPLNLSLKIYDINYNLVHQDNFQTQISGYRELPNLSAGDYFYSLTMTGPPCGSGEFESGDGAFTSVNCGLSRSMVIYPNPAASELNIVLPESKIEKRTIPNKINKEKANAIVKLVNKVGKVVRQAAYNPSSDKLTFTVGDLPNGNYFLHIHENGTITKKQVIIQH